MKRINLKLFLAIGFFLAVGLLSKFWDYSWSKKYLYKSVQSTLWEADKFLLNQNNSILNSNPEDFSQLNYSYLEYEKDSLIRWSENSFPQVLDKIGDKKVGVVYSNAGKYLFRVSGNKATHAVYGFVLIQNNFPFENEFLRSDLGGLFSKYHSLVFDSKESAFPLTNSNKQLMGYLSFKKSSPSPIQTLVLGMLFLAALVLFSLWIYEFIRRFKLHPIYQFLAYSLTSALVYFIALKSPVLDYLNTADIFQPEGFAWSNFIPSGGHFLMFLLWVFVNLLVIFHLQRRQAKSRKKWFNAYPWIWPLVVSLVFITLSEILQVVVYNSTPDINTFNLFSGGQTNYTSLLNIALISAIFFLIQIISFPRNNNISKRYWILSLGIISALLSLWFYFSQLSNYWFILIPLLDLYLIVLIAFNRPKKSNSLSFYILLLLILSVIVHLFLMDFNEDKERNKRKNYIQNIALSQDPELEYNFGEVENEIYSDTVFKQQLYQSFTDSLDPTPYIINQYFSRESVWEKYDIQITYCDKSTNLIVKPENYEVNCNDFFYQSLISLGYITSNKNLYRLDYGIGQINYLGIFRFYFQEDKALTVYIEINSKIKRKGFTSLLAPSGLDPFEKIRDYSLARYINSNLNESYGNYNYSVTLTDSLNQNDLVFFDKDDYNHLVYKLSPNEIFFLSLKNQNWVEKIAPFSYVFLMFILLSLLFVILFNPSFKFWIIPETFSFRLQLSFVALLGLSMIIITWLSTIYIKKLNNDKDINSLKNTAFSLQTEFEHKLANTVGKGEDMADYLNQLSNKFSKVFNTDINLYDLKGNLIVTTRPDVFDLMLLPNLLNPNVYQDLSNESRTYITHRESIGNLSYISAYMPFHDKNKNVVAYLNLPYFVQQDNLRKDLSAFIMSLINIYTFIIVFSILAVLLLSNYLVRPLKMIKEKMMRIRVGEKNDYIKWERKDEIGDLVEQYNSMVDKLAESATLLAKSERESAWRQMARQVAHEIKNPLTPMKLSVQYLMKTVDDKDPNWKEKLQQMSSTMIQQIDALSDIATAFSDFAKMPVGKREVFDLSKAILASLEIFENSEKLKIQSKLIDNALVFADKNNMIRVFNNLIKNAIQSIPYEKNGEILVEIVNFDSHWQVRIQDNGSGISEKEKEKVFLPNFTTKSSGMGLGLSMVRNIIHNNDGKIFFESTPNEGSTFFVQLKKVENA